MTRATGLVLLGLCLAATTVHAAKTPTMPVPLATVDLSRMQGDWYLVATIPNSFERGMVAGHTVYTLLPSGDLREDFSVRRGGFGAKQVHLRDRTSVRPDTGNADWRVHVFGVIQLPFQVLHVDPDYRFALFGEQNRKLGWIYSRTPTISDADYGRLLQIFRADGYDETSFRKLIQMPDQVGQRGFWNDGVKPIAALRGPPVG